MLVLVLVVVLVRACIGVGGEGGGPYDSLKTAGTRRKELLLATYEYVRASRSVGLGLVKIRIRM